MCMHVHKGFEMLYYIRVQMLYVHDADDQCASYIKALSKTVYIVDTAIM